MTNVNYSDGSCGANPVCTMKMRIICSCKENNNNNIDNASEVNASNKMVVYGDVSHHAQMSEVRKNPWWEHHFAISLTRTRFSLSFNLHLTRFFLLTIAFNFEPSRSLEICVPNDAFVYLDVSLCMAVHENESDAVVNIFALALSNVFLTSTWMHFSIQNRNFRVVLWPIQIHKQSIRPWARSSFVHFVSSINLQCIQSDKWKLNTTTTCIRSALFILFYLFVIRFSLFILMVPNSGYRTLMKNQAKNHDKQTSIHENEWSAVAMAAALISNSISCTTRKQHIHFLQCFINKLNEFHICILIC